MSNLYLRIFKKYEWAVIIGHSDDGCMGEVILTETKIKGVP